jgi:glycosyltransferase involved in cell wall biosynthesis
MKICLVSQRYPPGQRCGGIATQTHNKATALSRLGHEVHVLTRADQNEQRRENPVSENGRIVIHEVVGPEADVEVHGSPAYSLGYSWSVYKKLSSLLEQSRFDIVNFPEFGAEGFVYQLDRVSANSVPVVVHLHASHALLAERIGWPLIDSDLYRVHRWTEGTSLHKADALMATSADIADFSARFYGIPRNSIDVVHCGVDTDNFRPLGISIDRGARPTVLFVGNSGGNKGEETTLRAVLQLRERIPDILLRMAGRLDRDLMARLKEVLQSENGAESVEFLGSVGRDQLPSLYQHAAVFCSPAIYEGLGNTYVESMACGCPVVASTSGGASEAVDDGRTGLLVPPDDVQATVAALYRILSDENLRHQFGVAARRRVEDYFSIDRYIARVLATYESAIERHHRNVRSLSSAK